MGSPGEELVSGTPGSRTSNKMVISPSFSYPDLPLPLWALPGSCLLLHKAEKVATGSYNSTLPSSVTQQANTSHLPENREIKSQGKTRLAWVRPQAHSDRCPMAIVYASLTPHCQHMHSFASELFLGTARYARSKSTWNYIPQSSIHQ